MPRYNHFCPAKMTIEPFEILPPFACPFERSQVQETVSCTFIFIFSATRGRINFNNKLSSQRKGPV